MSRAVSKMPGIQVVDMHFIQGEVVLFLIRGVAMRLVFNRVVGRLIRVAVNSLGVVAVILVQSVAMHLSIDGAVMLHIRVVNLHLMQGVVVVLLIEVGDELIQNDHLSLQLQCLDGARTRRNRASWPISHNRRWHSFVLFMMPLHGDGVE